MNLNDLRAFVRTQLDLDETDLPDLLLDRYLQEGYDRIIALETRWPFFETVWFFTTSADGTIILTPDVEVIESLLASDGHRLVRVDSRWAEDRYYSTTGTAGTWSQINRTVHLHPRPAMGQVMYARGFRKSSDWIAGGASSDVDADERLHLPIAWYACSVGYAQQEDEVLEVTYQNRFRESVSIVQAAIMRPWTGGPKVLNGVPYGSRSPFGMPSVTFQLPTGAVAVP